MLLPDCKYCSGFFAVICLLPFSLLLLPPLFPSCPAAVPAVVLSAVSAGLALFPFCSHCCSCRCSFCCPGCSCAVPVALPAAFLSLPSPNFPCRPMRPVPPRTASGQPPFRARNPHWGLYERPLQNCVAAASLPYRACYAASGRGILRALARKILRGCLSGVFCMGARDPRVVRLPGRAGLDVYRIRFRT